jgi:hypothetical protein
MMQAEHTWMMEHLYIPAFWSEQKIETHISMQAYTCDSQKKKDGN